MAGMPSIRGRGTLTSRVEHVNVCVSDVRLALPSAFRGFSAAPFSVSPFFLFFRSHASASVTANIQRVERGSVETRTGGDAICAAAGQRASERERERERGEERGAGRRQAKRARACRCSPSARVWRSCVPSACPAPRRVKRLLVPCAFMLRHGKKATFPRRAGTRRTLSVCGVPCSGARARGVDCGLWTRIPRDRAGPAGCACTGRWSRVASASAAARTP